MRYKKKQKEDELLDEVTSSEYKYGFTTDMIQKKIKKTYKNRYFAHQKT